MRLFSPARLLRVPSNDRLSPCAEPPRLQWRYRLGFAPNSLFSSSSIPCGSTQTFVPFSTFKNSTFRRFCQQQNGKRDCNVLQSVLGWTKRHLPIILYGSLLIGMGKSQRYQAAVDGQKAAKCHWRNLRRRMHGGVRSRNTHLDPIRWALGDGRLVLPLSGFKP